MARLLMKNASHIVTCDPSDTVYTDSNLLMEDGVITYIGPEEQQAEEVTMWDAFFISKRAMNIPPFRGRPPSLLSFWICSVFLFNRLKYAKF